MNKKKKLAAINKNAARRILEIRAILESLSIIENDTYPVNFLITMAKKKLKNVFHNIEENRKILKIIEP